MDKNSMKIKKANASDFLNKKGRRIEFILFGLLLVFAAITPIFIYTYVDELINIVSHLIFGKLNVNMSEAVETVFSVSVSVVSWILAMLFVVFISFPMFSSFFGYSYKLYRNGIAGNGEHFPQKASYTRSLSTGGIIFGVLFVSLLPLTVLVDVASYILTALGDSEMIKDFLSKIKNEELLEFFSSTLKDGNIAELLSPFFFIVVIVGIVLSFCVFLLFKPLFLFGYFTARGEKAGRALKLSCERMRSPRAKGIYNVYIKSFLLSLVLSIISLLTLFLIDTLPKMTVVYFEIADEIVYGE